MQNILWMGVQNQTIGLVVKSTYSWLQKREDNRKSNDVDRESVNERESGKKI